jgi:hypothetical protein
VDQAVEFRKKTVQESRARGAETLQRRLMQPGQRELPLSSEGHWVNAISYTISTPIIYDMTFDIEREKDLRYRIRYQHAISINV